MKIITPELTRRARGTPRAGRTREEEAGPVAVTPTNTEVLGRSRGTPDCPRPPPTMRTRHVVLPRRHWAREKEGRILDHSGSVGGDFAPGPPRLWREGGPTEAQNTCHGPATWPTEQRNAGGMSPRGCRRTDGGAGAAGAAGPPRPPPPPGATAVRAPLRTARAGLT